MSKKYRTDGRCRLCGEHRQLTFEHVPPRGAFNDRPVRIQKYDQQINERSPLYGSYSKAPRGSGDHVLCVQCQTRTGTWYARHYVEFAHEVKRNLDRRDLSHHTYRIRPFRVLKHALTMFAAVESSSWLLDMPGYKSYLLDPNSRSLPDSLRLYFYCNTTGNSRLNGWSVQRMENGVIIQCAEVSSYPVGLVLSFQPKVPHPFLTDITAFATFSDEEVSDVRIRPFMMSFPEGFFQGISVNYQTVLDINGRRLL